MTIYAYMYTYVGYYITSEYWIYLGSYERNYTEN